MVKHIIYITLFTFLTFSCKKEKEISDAQADSYLKVFGGSSSDCCNSIEVSNDNLLLTGSLDYNNGPDMFLIKTDKFGNEVSWSPKFFGSALKEVGNEIIVDRNQNILLAGYAQSSVGTDLADFFVVKADQNGQELWSKRFGSTGDEKAFAINATISDIIFVAGYTESVDFAVKKRQGWLLALSQNGDSLWSHDYGINFVNDEINSILNVKDSLFLIGTTESTSDINKKDVFVFVLKGSTRGIENFQTLFKPGNETGVSAVKTPANEIIVLGYTEVSTGINNIYLWKIGENLGIIKQFQITSSVSETPSSIKLDNGNVVIVGTVLKAQDDEDILVYNLDTNLNVISRNQYGSRGNQRGLTGVIVGKNVIIGGSTTSESDSKASILKIPNLLP